jgi:hypothetical protein
MTAGQSLELLVNGEPAAQVRVMEGNLFLFSTRVKGAQNNTTITARVIANGRELDSASRNVEVRIIAPVGGSPTSTGAMKVRTQSGDFKVLMSSENGFAGTLVVQDAGFRAEISGSTVISRNPYVGVMGEFSGQVSASINEQMQQDVANLRTPRSGPEQEVPALLTSEELIRRTNEQIDTYTASLSADTHGNKKTHYNGFSDHRYVFHRQLMGSVSNEFSKVAWNGTVQKTI